MRLEYRVPTDETVPTRSFNGFWLVTVSEEVVRGVRVLCGVNSVEAMATCTSDSWSISGRASDICRQDEQKEKQKPRNIHLPQVHLLLRLHRLGTCEAAARFVMAVVAAALTRGMALSRSHSYQPDTLAMPLNRRWFLWNETRSHLWSWTPGGPHHATQGDARSGSRGSR